MLPRDPVPEAARPPEVHELLAVDGAPGAAAPSPVGPTSWRGSRLHRVAALLASGGLLAGLLALAVLRPKGLALRTGVVAASQDIQLYEAALDYEVQYEGSVEVYKWKSKDAPVLWQKWKCTIVRGQQDGDWVKLMSEPGFIPLNKNNMTTLRPIPVYAKIKEGTCKDINMFPIHDAHTCELAAAAMKLPDQQMEPIMLVPLPEGCHMFRGTRSTGLYLATNPLNEGNGAQHFHQPICSSYDVPSEPCRPPTTTVTTTSTSTTWGWPSLFCIAVGSSADHTTAILKDQLQRRAGVFSCDEFIVFTHGEVTFLGSWAGEDFYTSALPEDAGGNMTNSSFLSVWHRIKEDGRFRKHDWTVRVNPETVFFSDRLRLHLKAHTPAGGARLFFEKCDRFNPTRTYGRFEVRSRAAMDAFLFSEAECREQLSWSNYVEEEFVQKCLEFDKVPSVMDEDLLQDPACGSVNCWDKSKVAYRVSDDTSSYLDCWKHASR